MTRTISPALVSVFRCAPFPQMCPTRRWSVWGSWSSRRAWSVWGRTLLLGGALASLSHRSTAQASAPSAALLPASSAVRAATGGPGPQYWQNRAVYTIEVRLDTAKDILRGTLTLQYTNHSPDTLPMLWLQVPPQAALAVQQGGAAGPAVALQLERAPRQNGNPLVKVLLATPLAPGATATLTVKWGEHIQPESAGGTEGTPAPTGRPYHMTAWYPRVRVYDDVQGWDTLTVPAEQQYLDVSDYTVALTLPARYLVAATGMLDNPTEVLTSTERRRLALAATVDTVVPIVTAADLAQRSGQQNASGLLTWKFHARAVRDFGWLASQQYQWDATSWHGTLVQALYPPAAVTWAHTAQQAKEALQAYAAQWLPYPYPSFTLVYSWVGVSMSYGMLATINDYVDPGLFYGVLTHAAAHQWLGQLVGSNGRREPWLPEGLNTFWNTFDQARRDPFDGDQAALAGQDLATVEQYVREERDVPLSGGERRATEAGMPGTDGYRDYEKPAAMLQLLRREVLGPAVFDSAVRTYLRAWQGKQATGADFVRTLEHVAGRSLAWFWPGWLSGPLRSDPALAHVTQTPQGDGSTLVVTYAMPAAPSGAAQFPLTARVTLSTGTTQVLTVPAAVWASASTSPSTAPAAASRTYTVTYTFPHGHVTRLELDPEHRLVDSDRSNNVWTAP